MSHRSKKPNVHVVLVAVLTIVLLGVWQFDGRTRAAQQAGPPVPTASLPERPGETNEAVAPTPPPADTAIFAPVLPGDSLSKIFQRHALDAADMHRVLASGPHGKPLQSIYPGHQFEFRKDADGRLIQLVYRPGHLEAVRFDRIGDRFDASVIVRQPDIVRSYKTAIIDHSLFVAAQSIDLDDGFATRLAELFQWDVDFILDIRAGDAFHVLYEEHYVDGQFIGNGKILAAEFVNAGKSYKAVRFEHAGSSDYYAEDGRSLRKHFLRAPLDFTRISSNFNLNRIHPLWKKSMPHRGIDYAAPHGTPVRAVGDATVAIAGRTEANGIYVVLNHGTRYQTKYLHLSSFAEGLRAGQSVRQGEVIGRVGSTGWSTGPHLHYEFLVDGVHKNPRTVPLPTSNPIPEQERGAFHARSGALLQELEERKHRREVAQAGVES